jgi:hypothetical protein
MLRALLALGVIFGSSAVMAGPVEKNAVVAEPVHPMYLGSLNTGIKVNDAYVEGNFSIVAPVWSSLGAEGTLSGGLFFIEPYISWGEQGEVASSIGFGFRHLIGSQSVDALTKHDGHQASLLEEGVVLGANLFVDMLDTETNHQFWQLGVGAEVLTRYVEVRGNYYIPLTDKKEVGTFRTEQSFQTARQQTSIVGADPFATGNSILQPYTEITTQTTTTTTIERLFRRYEEGMEGWDLEFGLLLPWVDRYMDAKVIGGYYSFDNQPFGPQAGGEGNVEGWKAGLELRPVPAVVLNGTWYEDERLTGGDWTVSMRLEIPFEAGDLGDGKSLWSRVGESFKPRRRHLVERMAEPVRRQNAAVKLAHSVEEDEGEQQTSVQRVTRVVSRSQGQLVLADDVVFVNDGPAVGNGIQAGSATGTGTAELPVLTIQQGADLAGPRSNATGRVWSVYTQGVNKAYTESVTVSGSTNFIGSGKLIRGLSGKTFGTGPWPFLDGGIIATNVGKLGVAGYVIANGAAGTDDGVNALNVQNIVIDQNIFLTTIDDGVQVEADGSNVTSFVATGNVFNFVDNDGIEVVSLDASQVTAIISGNTFVNVGSDGIEADAVNSSRLTLVATDNLFVDGNTNAIDVQSFDNASMNFVALRNFVFNHQDDAFLFDSNDNSTFGALISYNVISNIGLGGLFGAASDSSTMNVTVTANTISFVGMGAAAAGIDLSTLDGDDSTLTALVAGNTISFAFGPGIAIGNVGNTSRLTTVIAGNSVDKAFLGGIHMENWADTGTSAVISGNSLRNIVGYGVHVDSFESSRANYIITGNVISMVDAAGIGLHVHDSAVLHANAVANNVIVLSDFHGMEFFTDLDAAAVLRIKGFDNNVILNSTDNGILLDAFPGSTLDIRGTLNNMIGPQGALRMESVGSPSGTIIINGALRTLPTNAP